VRGLLTRVLGLRSGLLLRIIRQLFHLGFLLGLAYKNKSQLKEKEAKRRGKQTFAFDLDN
jgi:hypothetical protein